MVRADALFGTPDMVAIVSGDDLAGMDWVIDRIVEVPEVIGTDSKVVRWIGWERTNLEPQRSSLPRSTVPAALTGS